MRIRVPANVDMPDRILAGLTLRQLIVLVVDALLVWGVASILYPIVPLPVVVLAGLPLAALGAVFAITATPGMGLDRIAILCLRFFTSAQRLVLAPENPARQKAGLGIISIPLESVDENAVLKLGSNGRAVVGRAGTLNLSLRAEREQAAIIDAFGRFLNSLEAPVHFLVRSEPMDLSGVIEQIEKSFTSLHPAVVARARQHVAFLQSLASAGDILRREVFICVNDPATDDSVGTRLTHRMTEAQSQLRPVGVRLSPLDANETRNLLRRCTSSNGAIPSGISHSDDVVSGGDR